MATDQSCLPVKSACEGHSGIHCAVREAVGTGVHFVGLDCEGLGCAGECVAEA